ncbi:MAG: site-specific integrase, partial [Planctomycetota bacterium]
VSERTPPRTTLTSRDIEGFFKWYTSHCRARAPLETHIQDVRRSINRFTRYLGEKGLFDPLIESPVYQPLLDTYLAWMRAHRHSAAKTLRLQSFYLTKFFEWLGPKVTLKALSKLTSDRVEEFVIAYAQTAGQRSRQLMQTSLRTFLRFCLHKGYTQQPLDRAIPTLRTYRLSTVPKGLSEEQAQAAFDSIDRSTNAGRRDYAILQILHTYGVRNGQVRALQLKDIEWKANTILFRASKRGKDSLLPLTREVGESLLDYLQNARPAHPFPEVFLTCQAPYGPLVRPRHLSQIVRRRIQLAEIDIPSKGANAFRHGFARRMIKEGNSLKSIADVLGHRQLSTTFIYAKVDFDALKQVALEWPEGEIL